MNVLLQLRLLTPQLTLVTTLNHDERTRKIKQYLCLFSIDISFPLSGENYKIQIDQTLSLSSFQGLQVKTTNINYQFISNLCISAGELTCAELCSPNEFIRTCASFSSVDID